MNHRGWKKNLSSIELKYHLKNSQSLNHQFNGLSLHKQNKPVDGVKSNMESHPYDLRLNEILLPSYTSTRRILMVFLEILIEKKITTLNGFIESNCIVNRQSVKWTSRVSLMDLSDRKFPTWTSR